MIDDTYNNAYKEISLILENTDSELLEKIPNSFLQYVEDNKNDEYTPSIDFNLPIDIQELLPETEAILAFIYSSYWADEEDKKHFAKELEKINNENNKPIDVFENKTEEKIADEKLLPIKKPNFFQRLFNKISNILKHRA